MQEFYGDNARWFIGFVVNNIDPLKLDRVKVRIQGLHSADVNDIPDDDLPWAQVNIPVTEDGSSGQGSNSQLKVRAQVFGIFLDGRNSQLPLVLGSIPKIETKRNTVQEVVNDVTIELNGNTNVDVNSLNLMNNNNNNIPNNGNNNNNEMPADLDILKVIEPLPSFDLPLINNSSNNNNDEETDDNKIIKLNI